MRMTTRCGRRRSGFSLAELMVAIGIFGIGMLMVAATFPVGLDQARIVAEETHAPLIADEAFATLQMLLQDDTPRISAVYPVDPADALPDYNLRNILNLHLDVLLNQSEPINPGYVIDFLPVPNGAGVTVNRPLNDWLITPYDGDRDPATLPEGGAETRYYPSVPARITGALSPGEIDARWNNYAVPNQLPPYRWGIVSNNGEPIEPRYYWSVLQQVYRESDMSRWVRFYLFVVRGKAAVPVRCEPASYANDDPDPGLARYGYLEAPLVWPHKSYNSPVPLDTSVLREGTYMVSWRGTIRRVKAIDGNMVQLDKPIAATGNPQTDDRQWWFVPVDPDTGRDPVIGFYTRSFQLN